MVTFVTVEGSFGTVWVALQRLKPEETGRETVTSKQRVAAGFTLNHTVQGLACVNLRQRMKKLFYQQFQTIKKAFSNFIFPPFCPICGNELKKNERLICEDCYSQIKTIESYFCRKCGAPLIKNRKTCDYCKGKNFYFSKVRALGTFSSPLSEMIHLLKYDRKTLIAERLGLLLGNLFISYPELSDTDVIIPVPLHRTRMRERGYNQSLLLAKKVSLISGKELCYKVVARTKATKSQTALDNEKRRENLKNAFSVVEPQKIKNKSVLVVDDVMTSGTTLDEIAKSLLESGADSVYGLILARALSV